jgi:hypothetical protein
MRIMIGSLTAKKKTVSPFQLEIREKNRSFFRGEEARFWEGIN